MAVYQGGDAGEAGQVGTIGNHGVNLKVAVTRILRQAGIGRQEWQDL